MLTLTPYPPSNPLEPSFDDQQYPETVWPIGSMQVFVQQLLSFETGFLPVPKERVIINSVFFFKFKLLWFQSKIYTGNPMHENVCLYVC